MALEVTEDRCEVQHVLYVSNIWQSVYLCTWTEKWRLARLNKNTSIIMTAHVNIDVFTLFSWINSWIAYLSFYIKLGWKTFSKFSKHFIKKLLLWILRYYNLYFRTCSTFGWLDSCSIHSDTCTAVTLLVCNIAVSYDRIITSRQQKKPVFYVRCDYRLIRSSPAGKKESCLVN